MIPLHYGVLRGAIIGVVSGIAANLITFGEVQPVNIILGFIIGGALGFFLP